MHWGTYPRPCLSEILSISASIRSLWQALSPRGTEQTPPPHFSLLQHFCGPGHSKSCWQELPQIAGSSNGHVPGLFKVMLDGQQTPYSCFGSTRQLYIGGQVGFPRESPQRNGLGESVICSGSPAGQIVDSDFALRQLGIGGHGGRAHVTSINSHVWLVPGQVIPRQGSRHSHLGQLVFGSICSWEWLMSGCYKRLGVIWRGGWGVRVLVKSSSGSDYLAAPENRYEISQRLSEGKIAYRED